MKPPTIREVLYGAQVSEYGKSAFVELAERVEAVLRLHPKEKNAIGGQPWCGQCADNWPCPTIRALEGRR